MTEPEKITTQSSVYAEFTDEDATTLSRAPLLRELSEDDVRAIRPHTHTVALRRGDRLYDEGDIDDQLYVVIEGKVKLTRTSSDGREVLVRVQGPGDMFGELAMFDPTYRTSNRFTNPPSNRNTCSTTTSTPRFPVSFFTSAEISCW